MLFKKKKPLVATKWSAELWSKIGGTTANFHSLLLIDRFTAKTDINFGDRSGNLQRTFFGTTAGDYLEREGAIPVSLNFHTDYWDQAQSRIPKEAVGWVHTVSWGKTGTDGATLSVNLRCDEKTVCNFVKMFESAKIFGAQSLEVLIWGENRSQPALDTLGNFTMVQPLSRCIFENNLMLDGS